MSHERKSLLGRRLQRASAGAPGCLRKLLPEKAGGTPRGGRMKHLHYDPERKWVLIFDEGGKDCILITPDGLQGISTDPKK
ncbi:hypothetical protein AKJ62_02790 [candidate division MSBL1 archaeon SCGC-AAA259D14]|uniref:Uncharacterized protein n=1 Tax=candidate division MSBL1 archaeon SCGC-AAA259D14 TaxID=1698261 RepID=A0A133U5X4_9EURY|nr:hypothetical protein AKJ62_02790 [candidate division MSBL1 archaeon SCGC-AAA259D14]